MDGVQRQKHSPRGGRLRIERPLKVAKFGGTSVGSKESLFRVVEIVSNAVKRHRVVVVASALSGVTDQLVSAWDGFERNFDEQSFIESLEHRHMSLARELLKAKTVSEYRSRLLEIIEDIRGTFGRMRLEGLRPAYRDVVLAAGERMSVPLLALALRDRGVPAVPVDAASLISTDDTFGEAVVNQERTFFQIKNWFSTVPEDTVPVVTGFIGSTLNGETTTLGRGGSDYSAALLASGLQAVVLERWTDVDGIYTEDPRQNGNAKRLASIVLEEAWAWNQAGRLGMHRKALDPLVAQGIPVHVRSTVTPDRFGTLIVPSGREKYVPAIAL